MGKQRLDTFLVQNNYFLSRAKAVDAIKSLQVQVNGKVVEKSSYLVDELDNIVIGEQLLPYVSKGGLKLEKALQVFKIDLKGKIVLDVGCSTGGFADCALQHGAAFVFGIDVGNNQLDERLKDCQQLKYIENLHVRDLKAEHLDGKKMDIVTADVSFIPLEYIFDPVLPHLKADSQLVLLIKPQFELSADLLDKNGFVRHPKYHLLAIEKVVAVAHQHQLFLQKIDYAPLMTYKKNIEYITLFSFNAMAEPDLQVPVSKAFEEKKKLKRNV